MDQHVYSYVAWPRWWRFLIVALATLILCSCRGPGHKQPLPDVMPTAAMPHGAGVPHGIPHPQGIPLPPDAVVPLPDQVTTGDWAHPLMVPPAPDDEYLCDGGDPDLPAAVAKDWTVYGLEMEDTVAHYDRLDGQTVVVPSNKVCLYAPRFSAVRSVTGAVADEQVEAASQHHFPHKVVAYQEVQGAIPSKQVYQAHAEIGKKHSSIMRGREYGVVLSSQLLPLEFRNNWLPFEDISVLKTGVAQNWEKAILAKGTTAAIAWTHDLAVVALVQGQRPIEVVGERKAQAVYVYDDSRGPAKLRIIKVASTDVAIPGEVVDFTLRFDNIGDQEIGNVTIIDNLTTRLEYVEGSAQSSVKSDFLTQANEGGSLVLRWEITAPMKPGEGGVVKFQCRVR